MITRSTMWCWVREVASIVLLDDDFSSIARAIAEGRQLLVNLRLAAEPEFVDSFLVRGPRRLELSARTALRQ